jgi:polyisoprenyl-teichoic acid--peptidoglycan teichoic acid transferase
MSRKPGSDNSYSRADRSSFDRRSHPMSGSRSTSRSSVDMYSSRSSRSSRPAGASRPSYSLNGSRAPHQSTKLNRRLPEVDLVSSRSTGVNVYSRGSSNGSYQEKSRHKKRTKRIVIITLSIVLALLLSGVVSAFAYISWINNQLSSNLDDRDALEVALTSTTSLTEPFWILLTGTDNRDADSTGLTDTMMLVRIDPTNKQAVIISIPRDLYVDLSSLGDYGYGKINAAEVYGGDAGAVEIVSQLAGVSISHYASIDFEGFKEIVDALGGVEVDVEKYVTATDASGEPLYNVDGSVADDIETGVQTLDGDQALVFARSRYYGIGDYQRTANQRVLVKAIAQKVLASSATTMLSVINSLVSYVGTDMSVQDIYQIATTLQGMGIDDIYSYVVPSTTTTVDGSSVVLVDETAWEEMMTTIEAGGLPDDQSSSIAGVEADEYDNADTTTTTTTSTVTTSDYSVAVRNGGGVSGSAASAASTLSAAGYTINETGNASQQAYDTTLIVYNSDSDLAAAEDIQARLGQGTIVQSAGRYTFTGNVLVVTGADWS